MGTLVPLLIGYVKAYVIRLLMKALSEPKCRQYATCLWYCIYLSNKTILRSTLGATKRTGLHLIVNKQVYQYGISQIFGTKEILNEILL